MFHSIFKTKTEIQRLFFNLLSINNNNINILLMDNSQPISRNRIPTVVKVYTHQSDWSKNMLYYSKGTVLNYG